nr:hypothetical protein CFP56_43910 [Quercus suber]
MASRGDVLLSSECFSNHPLQNCEQKPREALQCDRDDSEIWLRKHGRKVEMDEYSSIEFSSVASPCADADVTPKPVAGIFRGPIGP